VAGREEQVAGVRGWAAHARVVGTLCFQTYFAQVEHWMTERNWKRASRSGRNRVAPHLVPGMEGLGTDRGVIAGITKRRGAARRLKKQ
jgi:hypothetical protein